MKETDNPSHESSSSILFCFRDKNNNSIWEGDAFSLQITSDVFTANASDKNLYKHLYKKSPF